MTDLAEQRPDGLVDQLGDKIADLRAHLSAAHPLLGEWLDTQEPAELAALHRRLHGRRVTPEPDLVDVHLIETTSNPDEATIATLALTRATDHTDPLVWLPMRIADLVHSADAPGHTDRAGCRACADVIDAAIRAMTELDDSPQQALAELRAEMAGIRNVVGAAIGMLTPFPPATEDNTD